MFYPQLLWQKLIFNFRTTTIERLTALSYYILQKTRQKPCNRYWSSNPSQIKNTSKFKTTAPPKRKNDTSCLKHEKAPDPKPHQARGSLTATECFLSGPPRRKLDYYTGARAIKWISARPRRALSRETALKAKFRPALPLAKSHHAGAHTHAHVHARPRENSRE